MSKGIIPFPETGGQFRKKAKVSPNAVVPLDKARVNHPGSWVRLTTTLKRKRTHVKTGGIKPKKRNRSYINVCVSPDERGIVFKNAEKSHLTIKEYIRASLLGAGYISAADPVKRELLQLASRELGRQGHNLDQIAKYLSAGTTSPEQGDSMLSIITRSLLAAHHSVRLALAEGRKPD